MIKRRHFAQFILLLCLGITAACNKNSNELPAFTGADSSFVKPITLFDNRSDILSATFYRYKSSYHDSVFVRFKNPGSSPLLNLHIAVEISLSSPATYGNSKIYFNKTIALPAGDSSGRFAIAADQNLPFAPGGYNVYVLSYDSANGSPLGGLYENKFSLFRKGKTEITEFPQLYGFVQVDGSAVFRIKISDSLEYTIPNGRFEGSKYFSGYLMAKGQILSYLSLDTTQTVVARDSASFVFNLLKPLPDSTSNILINAYKH